MKNNKELKLQKKLEFLYEKWESITDYHNEKQIEYLLQEIDYCRTELLKIELNDFYREIDNDEDN